MEKLTIVEKKSGNPSILQITGEIDAKTAPDLKLQLELLIGNGITNVILDFTSLTYISSAGIGVLSATLKYLKEKSGDLVLCNLSKEVKDTLDLMYFTKKVKVFPSVDGALANF
ncbi:anti-sigma factor antagonist [Leptospira ognonensis]|uniref:Anti-sigma factor antagonist n=1 Tax=Leptospira ognonensis TaxID=2484945 RepID=A0A4R9JV56_9LEPT|nr:STAS domain-containing protein [Leptospira ognonensis]TGL56702.1 anti-sigma factor antagonist [Leptospira ognonensis]